MGSDPGDGWPKKGEYYDEDRGEWLMGPRPEKHRCSITVRWKPKGETKFVSWELEQDNDDLFLEEAAKVSWLFNCPDSFLENCVPSNVTQADVTTARDILTHVFAALNGDRTALMDLGPIADRLDEDPKGERKKAQFVDEVKELAIAIKAASPERQDELLKTLLSNLGFWCDAWAFKELDFAMVKQDVMTIDPHSTGGKVKGGEGKKGPPWLAARLIVMAKAREHFGLNQRRPNQTDDEYLDDVVGKLQNARRPGRGKPKASAKIP